MVGASGRGRLREYVRVAGFFALILGIMCLPAGWGDHPKRDQSVFYNLADIGAFLKYGVISILCGLFLLAASLLLPRDKS